MNLLDKLESLAKEVKKVKPLHFYDYEIKHKELMRALDLDTILTLIEVVRMQRDCLNKLNNSIFVTESEKAFSKLESINSKVDNLLKEETDD